MRRFFLAILALGILVVVVVLGGNAEAFPQYSFEKNDNFPPPAAPFYNGCRTCHGDFNSVNTEMSGQMWPSNLMDSHADFLVDGDCAVCHNPGPRFPVEIGASDGGAGLEPLSCSGCHGRAEDGTPSPDDGSAGYGAGLRRHHWNANVDIDLDPDAVGEFIVNTRMCAACHFDADPASGITPVGEDVKPPYYADPDGGGGGPNAHAGMPNDPCSDPTNADVPEEETLGDMLALDNDGDLAYDTADTDCAMIAASPGETSGDLLPMLRATAKTASTISLSYGPACGATDNTIVFGPLSAVSTLGYNGETCGILNSGLATWDFVAAGAPTNAFFLIVANDGSLEGSYGLGEGTERRNHDTNILCPLPQDLPNRCD